MRYAAVGFGPCMTQALRRPATSPHHCVHCRPAAHRAVGLSARQSAMHERYPELNLFLFSPYCTARRMVSPNYPSNPPPCPRRSRASFGHDIGIRTPPEVIIGDCCRCEALPQFHGNHQCVPLPRVSMHPPTIDQCVPLPRVCAPIPCNRFTARKCHCVLADSNSRAIPTPVHRPA